MMRQLPIRIRLSLWFFAAFSIATMALLAVCLSMVHRSIVELETNELHERVKSVQRFLEARPPDETLASQQRSFAVFDVTHGGKWLQVIDQDGNWIYRSKHVADVYPHLALPQELSAERPSFQYAAGDRHVRGLIAPITANGRSYTVQTGLTLNKTMVILGDFRRQLMVLTPIVLVLAAAAGYFMSRKALSPVAAIAAEARRISDRNLGNRLPRLGTRDELADMSETLNQMLDRIEAGYRSVREFTANAAHELRTPVSLISAEAEVSLAFQRTAEEYRDTCEHVQQEAVRMGKLIDTLLALTRADAGADHLHLEILDLNDLVREGGRKWAPQMQKASISFAVTHAPDPARILGDRPSLKRLLDILIDNAWRYTPQGGAISVSVSRDDRQAMLSVRDNGIGISPDDQPRVFDRFYRAGRPQNGEHAGSGLGLALARWIAEKHQTSINLRSEPGNGSCFSLDFACVSESPTSARIESSHRSRSLQSQ
ncbi:MAG: sensor histidine kinase [Isosphaeraceae bacterium]